MKDVYSNASPPCITVMEEKTKTHNEREYIGIKNKGVNSQGLANKFPWTPVQKY